MWFPVLLMSSLLTFSHGYVINPYNQPVRGSYGYGNQNGYTYNTNSWQGSQSRDSGQNYYGPSQYRPEGSGVPRDSTNGNYQSQPAAYVNGPNGLAYQSMGSYGSSSGGATMHGSKDNGAGPNGPVPEAAHQGYGPVRTDLGQYNQQAGNVGQNSRDVNVKKPEMVSQPEPRKSAPVDPDGADYPENDQIQSGRVPSLREQPSVRTDKQFKANDLIHFMRILNKLHLLD